MAGLSNMIKNLTSDKLENLKLNVYLKDGREFLGCDTGTKPFGETESIVAFWQDERIYMIPMTQVKEVVMTFE
jgi:hypothetical protein